VAFWKKANQVDPLPQKEELMAGRILKETWRGNHEGGKIVLYTLEGWKHNLPTKYHTRKLPGTDPLLSFHATEHIWQFFKEYRR